MENATVAFYQEPARPVPILSEVDVLVLGAGPAGFGAAVSAGRQGAKVLLVEQSGVVGGVATAGLMSHWTGETRGGLYEELLDRSQGDRASLPDLGIHGNARQIINHELLKLVMLEMLAEAGVTLRLYTFASAPILEGNRVTGVIIESKSGRQAIFAKTIVDASGDGDMAAAAGAPYYKGREYDGKMQPMTHMLKVGGVDTSKVRYVPGFEDTFPLGDSDVQSEARKVIPYPAGHVLIYPSTLPGTVVLNMTNAIKVDGTNADDLTRADAVCRSQIGPILNFLRSRVPGFEACYLLQTPSAIGVRETRHFVGEKTLNERDILEAKVFDDWAVTRARFNFDVHNLEGAGLDETGVQRHFRQQRGYTIPYGCFVPQKIDGLLLAGRCISGTHMAHSSYRVMPICLNMGQSVGIAAALCARQGVLPRNLPVGELQQQLRSLGVEP